MTPDMGLIRPLLNRCYQGLGYQWPRDNNMHSFQQYLRENAGMELTLTPQTRGGRWGYEVTGITVTDPARLNWWLLQWA